MTSRESGNRQMLHSLLKGEGLFPEQLLKELLC